MLSMLIRLSLLVKKTKNYKGYYQSWGTIKQNFSYELQEKLEIS